MPLRNLSVLALVATLALSACSSDDPEPKVAPEPTASTSSVATSSPSTPSTTVNAAPDLPTAAEENSAAGGRAFVTHWIALLNYATESGVTAGLADASADRCDGCMGVIETIQNIYADGGEIKGGTWDVKRQRPLPLDRGADYASYVEARVAAQTVTGVEGRKDAEFDPGPGYMYAYAAFRSGQWQMVFMDIPL